MIRDEELQSLLATSIDPSELHDFDPTEIDREATKRTRRRRIGFTTLGLVAIGLAASVLYPNQGPNTTPAAEPPAGMGPGPFGALTIKLTSGAAGGQGNTIATTNAGSATTIEVEITTTPDTRVLRGVLFVAAPGSKSGIYPPARMPANAAMRAENRIAEGRPILDVIPNRDRLSVTFEPTKPGTYPVYFMREYVQSKDGQPPPSDAATAGARVRPAIVELGNIVVQ
jgi:hypothetical protein